MATEVLTEYQSEDMTDAMVANAARLFSEHYGVWDTHPPNREGGTPGITSSPFSCYPLNSYPARTHALLLDGTSKLNIDEHHRRRSTATSPGRPAPPLGHTEHIYFVLVQAP